MPEPGLKSDRSQSGLATTAALGGSTYSGILAGGARSENRFRDLSSYLQAVKTIPWVFACVSVISYNFAATKVSLLDEDDAPVTDPTDPFLQVWNKPNPRMSGFQFRELFQQYMQLAGEAFISLEAWTVGKDPIPTEWYLPNPARMRVAQGSSGEVVGYVYDTTGQGFGLSNLKGLVPYDVDEIVHVKNANPLNELRGLGVPEAMEDTLNIVAEMTATSLDYWKGRARISGIFSTDQQVDDVTFNRLVTRWKNFTSDRKSRFKTMITEQGLKYQPIAEGLKGLDLAKLETTKRDEILANFGVPKNKLGIIEDAQYKSDEADRFFWSETMEPIFTRTEDGVQPLVDIYEPDRRLAFERRNFEDDTVKLNNAKLMQNLGFTIGEVFEYLMVDLPGGDKRTDMVILPAGTIATPVDKLGEPPPAPPAPPGAHLPPGLPPTTGGSGSGGAVPLPGRSTAANGNDNGRTGAVDTSGHLPNPPDQSVKGWDFLPEEVKESLRADYQQKLSLVRAVKRAQILRVPPTGLLRLNKAAKVPRLPAPRTAASAPGMGETVRRAALATRTRLTAAHKPKLAAAFAAQRKLLTPVLRDAIAVFPKLKTKAERLAWLKERWPAQPLTEAINALHVDAANTGWRTGKRVLGFRPKGVEEMETKEAALSYGDLLDSPVLADTYERVLGTAITEVDATTQAAVEAVVAEGIRRGYSPLQIANGNPDENYGGVAEVFDMTDYRAEMIARTESMFAFNWGSNNSLLDSGVTQVEAMDGVDDPECADRNGKIFDLDPDTGMALDDDGSEVHDHPNGTLALAPYVTADTQLVESGGLDTGEVTSFEGEEGAEWEVKVGTGQTNNPTGTNQTGHHGGGAARRNHTHANGVRHHHVGGARPHSHKRGRHKEAGYGSTAPLSESLSQQKTSSEAFHPVYGWGIKSPDGSFFTDEEGVVHPIRGSAGYDPGSLSSNRGSATGGNLPQVSVARQMALAHRIISPSHDRPGRRVSSADYVNAYRSARAAGLSHAETVQAIVNKAAELGQTVTSAFVESRLADQFAMAGLDRDHSTWNQPVAPAISPASGSSVLGAAPPVAAVEAAVAPTPADEVRGTGPGGRVTTADLILAGHPNGGINADVKAAYEKGLAQFQSAGGQTIVMAGGDPRAANLMEGFREVRTEVEAQNISSRARVGISYTSAVMQNLQSRGDNFRAVVALDSNGRPVGAVGFITSGTGRSIGVGVAGSTSALPGTGMAIQHGLAVIASNEKTPVSSTYLSDAKAAHASWGRTINSSGDSAWTIAQANRIATFKAKP